MKVTKRHLRRIIREEKSRLLREMDRDAMMDLEARERAGDVKQQDNRAFMKAMETIMDQLMVMAPATRFRNAETLIMNLETIRDQAKGL